MPRARRSVEPNRQRKTEPFSVRCETEAVSDQELARQTRAGSVAAFEGLVYRYERRIFTFLANMCRDRRVARELTQDTFVKAFQAIQQFDPAREFAPWLFAIARRKCIDHHRAAPPVAVPILEVAAAGDPSTDLAHREEEQALWQLARRRLSPDQFQALWLRYAEDMGISEIARVLRKHRVHVNVLLFRARTRLANHFQSGAEERDVRRRVTGEGEPRTARPVLPLSAKTKLGLFVAGQKRTL